MVIEGKQVFEGRNPIPVKGDMLISCEFYVIAKELGPEYGNAIMLYAPEDRETLEYGTLSMAAMDLEEIKKHPSLADVGIYKMSVDMKRVL